MRKKLTWFVVSISALFAVSACQTVPVRSLKAKALATKKVSSLPTAELEAQLKELKSQGKSFREALTILPHIKAVYAVDDYYTQVVPTRNTMTGFVHKEAYMELVAAGKAYGGVLEVGCRKRDPITDKWIRSWKPIEVKLYPGKILDKGDVPKYIDPMTGKPDYFDFSDPVHVEFANFDKHFRWRGLAAVVDVYQDVSRTSSGFRITRLKSFILKHDTPQPFVYKSEFLPPKEQITEIPPDGKLLQNARPFAENAKAGFLGVFAAKDYSWSDIFEYVSALCSNHNGKCKWVINKKIFQKTGKYTGRLEEVEAMEAFKYWASPSRGHTWYMACQGDTRFVVRGTWVFNPRINSGHYEYIFMSNRGLEGLGYAPLAKKVGRETFQVSPVKEPHSRSEGIAQNLALAAASAKAPVTQTIGVQQYTGLYNGTDADGCALVSVVKRWDITMPADRGRTETYNFKVCNGKVVSLGETMPQSLPDEIVSALSGMSKTCQMYGRTQISLEGYQIHCRPLRDESKCKVEITVLRNGRLVEKRIYDGCKGVKLQ